MTKDKTPADTLSATERTGLVQMVDGTPKHSEMGTPSKVMADAKVMADGSTVTVERETGEIKEVS